MYGILAKDADLRKLFPSSLYNGSDVLLEVVFLFRRKLHLVKALTPDLPANNAVLSARSVPASGLEEERHSKQAEEASKETKSVSSK